MLTIPTSTQLNFMQSFNIDEKDQKYETVRVPRQSEHDISPITNHWESDADFIMQPIKNILVYMNKSVICFSFLQENEVIFEQIFQDIEINQNTSKIYFEIFSEGNKQTTKNAIIFYPYQYGFFP